MTVFNDDCIKVMDNFKDLCPWGGYLTVNTYSNKI